MRTKLWFIQIHFYIFIFIFGHLPDRSMYSCQWFSFRLHLGLFWWSGRHSIGFKIDRVCLRWLDLLSGHFTSMSLLCVPGHCNIPGNCRANQLARAGTLLSSIFIRQSKFNLFTSIVCYWSLYSTWVFWWLSNVVFQASPSYNNIDLRIQFFIIFKYREVNFNCFADF